MKKFVMDIVMEPIKFADVEVLQFEIEERIKSWLRANKIKYNNLKVNIFSTRAILIADLETDKDWLESHINDLFKTLGQGDIVYLENDTKSFYRPILNIVSFLDGDCLHFEIANVKSSDENLINFKERVKINSAEYYLNKMSKYFYASNEECFDKISSSLKRRAVSIGKKLTASDERIYNLSYIDGFLSVVDAEFKEEFLELPTPIIESVLDKHKNIFSTYYDDSNISNSFLIVYKDGTDRSIVKASHVMIINSELNAIKKLFNKDLNKSLEDYLPRLDWISTYEALGSMYDKTRRVEKIVDKIADELSIADVMNRNLEDASRLMKADLGTRTVKCYPDLKGVVGAEMLKIQNENAGVSDAVREQYLPDFTGKMPSTILGAILAIVDRIHDLSGLEIVGKLNLNSSWTLKKFDDILRIMISIEPELSCGSIIENSLYAYTENSVGAFDYKSVYEKLFDVFKGRFKYLLYKNNVNKLLIDDIFIGKDTAINNQFRKLNELSSIKDEDLMKFLQDIIDYKKLIAETEAIEAPITEVEAKFGDVLKYADGKAEDTVDFLKILYEYRSDFYDLFENYRTNGVTSSAKSLANNFKEMWL